MVEVIGGSRDKVGDTQGVVHILWDCGCRHQRNWGARQHLEKGGIGLCQTLTRIVSGLVEKWGCVKSPVLVEKGGQQLCKEHSSSGCHNMMEISAALAQSGRRNHAPR